MRVLITRVFAALQHETSYMQPEMVQLLVQIGVPVVPIGHTVPSVWSHCSVPFLIPSPQYGPRCVTRWQVVESQYEQVPGGLLYAGNVHVVALSAPSSHVSVPSISPLPQPPQSSGQLASVSVPLHVPSPQYGPTTVSSVHEVVQVVQVFGGFA
jgi:hypothetical protein